MKFWEMRYNRDPLSFETVQQLLEQKESEKIVKDQAQKIREHFSEKILQQDSCRKEDAIKIVEILHKLETAKQLARGSLSDDVPR